MYPYTYRGKDWGKCRGKHSPEISLILPKIHLRSLKFRTGRRCIIAISERHNRLIYTKIAPPE